jgi:signal transduction histidine kinase
LYLGDGFEPDETFLSEISEDTKIFQLREVQERYYIHIGTKIQAMDRVLYLETMKDITQIYEERKEGFGVYRKVILFVLICASVIMYLICRWLTKPIRLLTKATQKMAEGDYGYRAKVISNDEMGQLTDDFNKMAGKLEENISMLEADIQAREEFIAAFAHELKTPLTVIITEAELLSDPNTQEETRRQCSANILETSQRMRSLTEEMLDLARAENAREERMEEVCSLSELLEDSILSFEPLFFEKGLELRSDIEGDIAVKGNRTRLLQLGEILLDNAQKYSLPGIATLTLKKHSHKTCELTLDNPAHPLEEEEQAHIFDRFYRADKARTATGSYGLGLSIAHSIVHSHHGTIKAEQQDGTITFRIRLPIVT